MKLQEVRVTRSGERVELPLCTLDNRTECKHRIVLCPQLYPVCLPFFYYNTYSTYKMVRELVLDEESLDIGKPSCSGDCAGCLRIECTDGKTLDERRSHAQ